MTRRRSGFSIAAVAVIILIAVAGIIYYLSAQHSCNTKHGVLVKGPFGYSCVASPTEH